MCRNKSWICMRGYTSPPTPIPHPPSVWQARKKKGPRKKIDICKKCLHDFRKFSKVFAPPSLAHSVSLLLLLLWILLAGPAQIKLHWYEKYLLNAIKQLPVRSSGGEGAVSVGRRSLWRAAKTTLIKLIWYNKEKFASCQNHNDWFWIIARPAREEGGGHGNALKGHFAAICFEGNEGSATPKRKRKRKRNRFE